MEEFTPNTLAFRIAARLKKLNKSAAAASFEATGKRDAIRKIYDAARGGVVFNPRMDTLRGLAASLETSVAWLTDATGPENVPPRDVRYAPLPEDEQSRDFDPDWEETPGAGVVDGRLSYQARLPGGIPETARAPGAGAGMAIDDRAARIQSNGIATGHRVVAEWVIPPNYLRDGLSGQPGQVVVMPVIGHSMVPMLQSNDRVLVDTSQNIWIADAVYVIDDGDTRFQVKTVKKVLASPPPRYRIVSEASPEEQVFLNADQFRIVGRVVGRFTKM